MKQERWGIGKSKGKINCADEGGGLRSYSLSSLAGCPFRGNYILLVMKMLFVNPHPMSGYLNTCDYGKQKLL